MRTYANKVDANQDAIVLEYERLGCEVHRTNRDWDLTVDKDGIIGLVEIKNPATLYGRKGLNKRQQAIKLHRWVVYTPEHVAQHVAHLDAIAEAIRRAA